MTLEQKAIKLNNLLIREEFSSLIFFFINMKYIREKALKWWSTLSDTGKTTYCLEYRFTKYKERSLNYHSLTGREIEEIYLKYK